MFYLPRICEHCLNPSCMASCPSGAIYKRSEDGIVLVDQDRCRGWRQCITGCPYKKIYFNHKSGKAEKCTFCYPRVEVGLPTVCSETCVGRLRYLGLFLYDADAVTAAAVGAGREGSLRGPARPAARPERPRRGRRRPAQQGIPEDWLDAARRSPVYALAKTYRVALPLHPEYRTMPMVWYVPPLSPVVDLLREQGHDAEDPGTLFGAIEALRIPVEYLAELFTAGDTEIVSGVLRKLAAMRAYMRDVTLGREPDASDPGGGRDDRGEPLRDVPADGDREVRRALRHPEGARRAGARPRGARLLAGLRRRSGDVRVRAVRRGQRPAGAGGGGDVPRPQAAADGGGGGRLRRPARPGQPAQLGRQRHPAGPVPGPAASPGAGRREAPTYAWSARWRPGACRYPDEALVSPAAVRCGAALDEQPLRIRDRPLRGFLDRAARWTPRRSGSARTSTPSTSPASTRSTCRTGPTATPGGAGRCWARSSSATATAASSSTSAASCPTTCRWCWSSPPSWTRPTAPSCCRTYRPSLELLRLALLERRQPVRRRARRPCARPCRVPRRPTARR